jgi:rare lipoprotein A
MRVCAAALGFLLVALVGSSMGVAQSSEDKDMRDVKPPSRGFEWFFANVRRPETRCDGQHVVATWYATGHRTASGEAFNPDGHTAAHRTLPFGTRLTITNPRTGKSVTVIINDRGPITKGVTLDLARGAARAIGMKDTQWVCMAEAS